MTFYTVIVFSVHEARLHSQFVATVMDFRRLHFGIEVLSYDEFDSEPVPEYKPYQYVYYLNDAALRLVEAARLSVTILGRVSSSDPSMKNFSALVRI